MLTILLTLAALICITLTGLIVGSLVTYCVVKGRFRYDIERYDEPDYCMCGDRIDCHTWGSGHSPVSQRSHYLTQLDKFKVDLFWRMD